MDGLEMMQQLKSRNYINTQRIVFILLGTHSTPAQIEAFKKLGVQEYTSKPLSEQTVMDAYHKYFADDTARDHTSS
jgi:response regulator RpfG family c-di-GMP phosphodiesterase